jgi:hypothetical protein
MPLCNYWITLQFIPKHILFISSNCSPEAVWSTTQATTPVPAFFMILEWPESAFVLVTVTTHFLPFVTFLFRRRYSALYFCLSISSDLTWIWKRDFEQKTEVRTTFDIKNMILSWHILISNNVLYICSVICCITGSEGVWLQEDMT